VRFSVRANDAGIAEGVMQHLPPGGTHHEFSDRQRVYSLVVEDEEKEGSDKPRGSVYVDDKPLFRRVPLEVLLRAFEANIQLHVAEMAPEHVFVHAGVVGWRRGIHSRPQLLATLVTELVRSGTIGRVPRCSTRPAACTARRLSMRVGGPGVTTSGGRAPVDKLAASLCRSGWWWCQVCDNRMAPRPVGAGGHWPCGQPVPARRSADHDGNRNLVTVANLIAASAGASTWAN
jgi:hypothetical protein